MYSLEQQSLSPIHAFIPSVFIANLSVPSSVQVPRIEVGRGEQTKKALPLGSYIPVGGDK